MLADRSIKVPGSIPAARDERVRAIVQAAATAMGRAGYAGTSMKDIAREAGVAQGLIHYYFGSKEELVLEVLRACCHEMMETTRAGFREVEGGPLARGWSSLQAAGRRAAERPELFRLVFEMISLSVANPALKAQLQDLYAEITEATQELVEELSSQLPTPLPIPSKDFAAVIVAAIDGLAVRMLVDDQVDPEALYRALGFVLISSAAAGYAYAGQPMPVEGLLSELFPPAAPA